MSTYGPLRSFTLLLLVSPATLGCASDRDERRQSLTDWQAPPPSSGATPTYGPGDVVVVVTGPEANADNAEHCRRTVQALAGGPLSPNAPVRATLILRDGHNELQISSLGRGLVLRQGKPGWGMDELCSDAYQTAVAVAQREPVAATPQANSSTSGPGDLIVVLSGPNANADNAERCRRVVQALAGGALNPNATVRATLILRDGQNELQITSARRGLVVRQPKPGWGVDELCSDAYRNALTVAQEEYARPQPVTPPPQ